jgi:hypothetical protein
VRQTETHEAVVAEILDVFQEHALSLRDGVSVCLGVLSYIARHMPPDVPLVMSLVREDMSVITVAGTSSLPEQREALGAALADLDGLDPGIVGQLIDFGATAGEV